MSLLTTTTGRRMMDGTARILLAELLFPLTALITTGFLTRQLGPQGYGVLALALTTIIWIESAITSFFTKATIKFVGETNDWEPVARHDYSSQFESWDRGHGLCLASCRAAQRTFE